MSSILATLHPATSGDILFNGISIYKNISNYRKQLSFCPQEANLDTELNVEDNLLFAGRFYLVPEKELRLRVDRLIERLHLEKYRYFHIEALSGGNRQRVLIARALVNNPRVVILDEPTVGLDPDIRRQIWEIVKDLKKEGINVILTTHYLDEAEVLADRVCLMDAGKIIFIETVENLKKAHKQSTLEEIFLELTRKKSE